MLPLRVLSQTAHKSCIEPIVIILIRFVVPGKGQCQGVHVLWCWETSRKHLHRDYLRKNTLPQIVIARQSGWLSCVPRRETQNKGRLIPRQVRKRPARVAPIYRSLVYYIQHTVAYVEA